MEPILDVKNLNLWYGQTHALRDVSIAIPPPRDHCLHRSLRLRKIHVSADAEPHE